MNFVSLLGSQLKSDSIIELLDIWECDVVYDFDRLHENMPDKYWVTAESEGAQFCFNEDQILVCIFLYVVAVDGFSPVGLGATDVPVLESPDDVSAFAKKQGINMSAGEGELFGQTREWGRLEWGNRSIHYEFREGVLSLVTLTSV